MPPRRMGPAREQRLAIALASGGELPALDFAPPGDEEEGAPRPACLLVAEPGGGAAGSGAPLDAQARAMSQSLVGLGLRVLAPELAGGAAPEGAAAGAAGDVPDRVALARLDAAVGHLAADPAVDAERIAAVGLGRGGTLAFLLGCHSRDLAALVSLGGPLVYPELGPARPLQPLEMALNLSCPCLLVFADHDPATPEPHRTRAREALSQFARAFDIVTCPGTRVSVEGELLDLVGGFLRETLELA